MTRKSKETDEASAALATKPERQRWPDLGVKVRVRARVRARVWVRIRFRVRVRVREPAGRLR